MQSIKPRQYKWVRNTEKMGKENTHVVQRLLFFVGVAGYTIIYAVSMYFAVLNEYEKEMISGIFGKLLGKFRKHA